MISVSSGLVQLARVVFGFYSRMGIDARVNVKLYKRTTGGIYYVYYDTRVRPNDVIVSCFACCTAVCPVCGTADVFYKLRVKCTLVVINIPIAATLCSASVPTNAPCQKRVQEKPCTNDDERVN